MSFVSVPPARPAAVISNTGFFPDIDLADARDAMRIDGTASDARLRVALVEAITSVNRDLIAWRQTQIAVGITKLSDIDADHIDGISELVHNYKQAVFSLATASLQERYRSFDTTWEGHTRAGNLEMPIDDLRRDARCAIRNILGTSHTTVELI